MKTASKIAIASILSLGIIGGAYAYGKHRFGDPAKRATHAVNYVADELNLDSNQKAQLTSLKDELMTLRESLRGDFGDTMDSMAALIGADSFDQAAALQLITEKTRTIEETAPQVLDALGTFLDGLTSDQKAQVNAFLEERGEHRRWHRHRH